MGGDRAVWGESLGEGSEKEERVGGIGDVSRGEGIAALRGEPRRGRRVERRVKIMSVCW